MKTSDLFSLPRVACGSDEHRAAWLPFLGVVGLLGASVDPAELVRARRVLVALLAFGRVYAALVGAWWSMPRSRDGGRVEWYDAAVQLLHDTADRMLDRNPELRARFDAALTVALGATDAEVLLDLAATDGPRGVCSRRDARVFVAFCLRARTIARELELEREVPKIALARSSAA